MGKLWRNRRLLSSVFGELGCGLLTVFAFTLPLWAFSLATRGPRYALTVLAGLVLVLAVVAILTQLLKRR